jgi:uncharacterized membrane protein YhaH (DUF805 family)
MNWRKLLLSPHGRIGRKSYWIAMAVLSCAWLISDLIDRTFGTPKGEAGPTFYVVTFVAIYPSICIQTKRFHDLNHTGWLQVLPWAVMMLFGPLLLANYEWGFLIGPIVAGLVMAGLFIWTAFFRGAPGPNRYGEPNSGDREVAPVVEVFS